MGRENLSMILIGSDHAAQEGWFTMQFKLQAPLPVVAGMGYPLAIEGNGPPADTRLSDTAAFYTAFLALH